MKNNRRRVHEPLVHLTRRLNVSQGYAWCLRIGAFILSILACAIVSMLVSKNVTFGFFFKYLFKGAFGTSQMTQALIRDYCSRWPLPLVSKCVIGTSAAKDRL